MTIEFSDLMAWSVVTGYIALRLLAPWSTPPEMNTMADKLGRNIVSLMGIAIFMWGVSHIAT